MSGITALDLFAGTGWGVACNWLGISELGVELMDAAVATREANGMHTIYRDVWDGLAANSVRLLYQLLIASPPCQTFSIAGSGKGRAALEQVLAAVASGAWRDVDLLRALGEETDPRTALVLTPLAQAYRDRPRFIIFEQVPPVLPVWEACARELELLGYSTWTGVLNAEQFGVPQTRKRAILIARLDGEVTPPVPTHSRFYTRKPDQIDAGVLKWVSMAEALGWGMTHRPYPTVTTGTAGGGTDPAALGGSGARRTVMGERAEGRWVEGHDWNEGGPSQEPDKWEAAKAMGAGMVERHGDRPGRSLDEPAFTIRASAGGMEPGGFRWRLRPEVEAFSEVDRPAPTVAGDPRLAPRGCKHPGPGCCTNYPGTPQRQFGEGTLRLTLWEAQILQSYPPDFVFVGNRGRQFEQVGNAVPPLLARAIIEAAIAR